MAVHKKDNIIYFMPFFLINATTATMAPQLLAYLHSRHNLAE
jgi:hypothetical protein